MITEEVGPYALLGGSTGRVIAAAMQCYPREETRQRLAKQASISVFAAGRAATALLEVELLVEGRRGVVWNRQHDWAAELERAVRLTTGVTIAADNDVWSTWGYLDRSLEEPGWMSEDELPPSVRRAVHRQRHLVLPVTVKTNPSQLMSRLQADKVRDVARAASAAHLAIATAYERWHAERARDAIHSTLHWGQYTQSAIVALDQTAGQPTAATGWVRALYRLVAFHRSVEWWISVLDRSVLMGQQYRRLQTGPNGVRIEDSAPAEQLAESYHRRLWWLGGMPSPADVGGLGDMVMAGEADHVRAGIEAVMLPMSDSEIYRDWADAYPDEAAKYAIPAETEPLVDREAATLD